MLTVEVNRAGPVGVNLSDHAVHLIGCYLIIQGGENFPERARWNVAVALLVVKPEGLFQLLLQGLVVLLLEVTSHPVERVEI